MRLTALNPLAQRRLIGLAVVLLAAWAAWCAVLAMRPGIGMVGDSVDYVAAARQAAAGGGLKTLDGQGGFIALRQFPPGYPLALAAWSTITQHDAARAAVSFNAAALALVVLLSAGVTWRWTRSGIATITTAALLAGTSPLLPLATRLLSEVPFVVLCLAAVHAVVPTRDRVLPTWRMTVVAGLLIGATLTVRYAGLFLLIAAVPWLLSAAGSWRRNVGRAAVLVACAAALPLAWAARNVAVSGEATSRQIAFHPPGWSAAGTAIQTVASWTLPARWPTSGATLVVGLIVIAVALLTRDRSAARWWFLIGSLMAAYLVMLLVVSTWFDAAMPWNYRILAPLYPLGLIAAVRGGDVIARRIDHRIDGLRAVRVAAAVVLLAALGVQLMLGLKWARKTGRTGYGYSTAVWRDSATLAWIAGRPQIDVTSNADDAVYARLGRVTRRVPKSFIRNAASTNPALGEEIAALRTRLGRDGGAVVYFTAIDRDGLLIDQCSLRDALRTLPRSETIRLADGVIDVYSSQPSADESR